MTTERAPYHAHIYFEPASRPLAEQLHQRFTRARLPGAPFRILFVGEMRDRCVGPHPKPQFEIHFLDDALPDIMTLLRASGLTVLIHPLTDNDLADHTSLASWIGEPLPLDHSVLDPPGANQALAQFGKPAG